MVPARAAPEQIHAHEPIAVMVADIGGELRKRKLDLGLGWRPKPFLDLLGRRNVVAHRFNSQVVPSFESFSTTPMAASSSRMRSDSLKFFALRAAMRSETKYLIRISRSFAACVNGTTVTLPSAATSAPRPDNAKS